MSDIFYQISGEGRVVNDDGIQDTQDVRVFNIFAYGSPLSSTQVPASPFFKCRNLIANLRCTYITDCDCESSFEDDMLELVGSCIDEDSKNDVVLVDGVWNLEHPDIHLLIKKLYDMILDEIDDYVVVVCTFNDDDFFKITKYLYSDLKDFDHSYMIGDCNTVLFYV